MVCIPVLQDEKEIFTVLDMPKARSGLRFVRCFEDVYNGLIFALKIM